MTVKLAGDIASALVAASSAHRRFDALPPSHKREYLSWIDEAKKPETRARRIVSMIERLAAGDEAR